MRSAIPSMSYALQRDLRRLVHQQPVISTKPSQRILRAKRGLITTAAEGNGAGPASTGLSIDLRGDAMRSLCSFCGLLRSSCGFLNIFTSFCAGKKAFIAGVADDQASTSETRGRRSGLGPCSFTEDYCPLTIL